MNEISGTYRDGHVELNAAVNWPEGTAVTVVPQLAAVDAHDSDPPGTRFPYVDLPDGTILPWSDTPEFRAALLAQMDSREPFELTPEEEAQWQADRRSIKEYTLAAMRREMEQTP
jgi:hypothetical protein